MLSDKELNGFFSYHEPLSQLMVTPFQIIKYLRLDSDSRRNTGSNITIKTKRRRRSTTSGCNHTLY